MYKYFIWFTILIAVCSFAAWASVSPQKGKAKENGGKAKESGSKIKETRNLVTNPEGCTSPRPRNIGCKIACKPCQVPVCENGKWKYERIEWDKEECKPIPGSPGGQVCVVGPTDFCPAECKKCIRQ